jgi:hypothetical protein
MQGFQKIVITIAIVLLIIALIFVGYTIVKNKKNQQWPPLIAECPDYWLMDGSGNNTTCINVKHLGNSNTPNTMKFNMGFFTGSDGLCNKYMWSIQNDITWDGITYGVNNPCQQ